MIPFRVYTERLDPNTYTKKGLTLEVFSFDVAISDHDSLKRGILVRRWTRVVVAAPTYNEAFLTAQQMGSCFGMVTGCLYRY